MDSPLPQKIGKYRIQRELGRGGSCVVYLGFDPFTRRSVAIKTTRPDATHDQAAVARLHKLFLKEAGLAGKLSHPHIVRVFDAVIEGDVGYIVMEYVPGGTLKQYCHLVNLLPVDEVVEIAFKCGQALDYANRQGVVHRDIKPANIMVHGHRDVKIADFGAAQLSRSEQTRFANQMGSPAYMSPEQVRDQEQDFRTDMYSLGVVMYELLTGRQPFVADSDVALAYKILNEEPVPVRVLRSSVPEALEKVVLRAMSKNPARRFASWEDFGYALTEVHTHLRLPAAPIGEAERFGLLKELDFFADFGDVELWEVLRMSQWRTFPPASLLQKEGNIGSAVFVLADGTARVAKKSRPLGHLSKGDCFGEMSYLDPALARPVTISAETSVTLVKIKASSLRQASENCQLKFNRAFLKILVRRLADAEERLTRLPPGEERDGCYSEGDSSQAKGVFHD